MSLFSVQRQSVREVKSAARKQAGFSVRPGSEHRTVCFLPVTGVGEVQISLRVEDAEVGIRELASAAAVREQAHVAVLANLVDPALAAVENVDILFPVERDAEAEAAGVGDGLHEGAVRGYSIDLTAFASGVDRAIASDCHPLGMVQPRGEFSDFRD